MIGLESVKKTHLIFGKLQKFCITAKFFKVGHLLSAPSRNFASEIGIIGDRIMNQDKDLVPTR